jgi:hypothetical protein
MHSKKVRRIVPVAQTKHSCERSLFAQALHASGAGRSEVCARMNAPSWNLEVGHQAQLGQRRDNGYAIPQLRRQDIRLRQGGSKVRIASASQCCRPSTAGCDLLNECKTVSRLLRQSNQHWGCSSSNLAWRWCTRWMFTYLSGISASRSHPNYGWPAVHQTLKWIRLHKNGDAYIAIIVGGKSCSSATRDVYVQ